MGLIGRFEKGLDRAVNGVFAKAFRSEVQPVEIASALRRECDDQASIVARDRTVAPNSFVVELGTADYERLDDWEQALSQELGAAVIDHARQQRYAFVGPVSVAFEQADDLDTGVFRVRSATAGGPVDTVASGRDRGYPPPPPGQGVPADRGNGGPWLSPPAQGAPSLDVDGRIHRLASSITVIGRSTEADVVLDDAGVSRRHAEVHLIDGRARVIDLGSTNGTYVDGERVHAGNLTEGSTITVGRTRIVYHSGQW
ncbi:MAG: hypothetical protein QG622_1737 [Actinomycetota bacterium]|nr:hypothetical protein [Actinomycetota bacterium]